MRIKDILHEARQPTLMFHGTSTALLRSIRVNGIVPNPPDRTWETDPAASSHSPSRASLEGSYWTSNLMTALSSAFNTCRKFGGNRMIVCATIQEQAAFADEDSLHSKINTAFSTTMQDIAPNVRPDAVGLHLSTFFYKPDLLARAKIDFVRHVHQELGGTAQMPIDQKMLSKVFDDFLMRKLVHEVGNDPHSLSRWFQSPEHVPQIPSIDQAEQVYHADLEWLTRRYRASAYAANDSFNHTLRLNQPVGFRGTNRIICIIEELPADNNGRNTRVLYGQVPAEFIAAWEKSIGSWKAPVTELRKVPGPPLEGSGKDFRQNPGINRSPKQPGNLMGSGKPLKVKPGFVG